MTISSPHPAGIWPVEGIIDHSQAGWVNNDPATAQLKIVNTPDTTVFYGFPAVVINDTQTYEITVRHKSSVASAAGLYLRVNELNSQLGQDITHVGVAAIDTNVATRTGFQDLVADGAFPGTTFVETTYTYQPTTGTKYMTFSFGFGINAQASMEYHVDYARIYPKPRTTGQITEDADVKFVTDNEKTGAGHGFSNLDAGGLKDGRNIGGALKLSAGGKLQLQSDSTDVINTLGNFQKDVQGSVGGRTASTISGAVTASGNLAAGKKIGGDTGLSGDRVGEVIEDVAGAGKIKSVAVITGRSEGIGTTVTNLDSSGNVKKGTKLGDQFQIDPTSGKLQNQDATPLDVLDSQGLVAGRKVGNLTTTNVESVVSTAGEVKSAAVIEGTTETMGDIEQSGTKVMSGAPSVGSSLSNWNFLTRSSDYPAGIIAVEGIVDQSQLHYLDVAKTQIKIESTPDTTVAYGFPAMLIDDTRKYEITIRHKSSAASATGLYLRFNELAAFPDAGITHIGLQPGAPAEVQTRDSYVDLVANGPMPGTTWVINTYTYTPRAGTKFASFSMYNWNPTAGVEYHVDYVQMFPVPRTTTEIAEGTNLYYTDARARAAITGGASSIVTANLAVSRALVSDGSGKVAAAVTTSAEVGYLQGVTSAIQTQLNGKEPSIPTGTTAQYWRGDKTWQTLNTTAVAEGTNLYFTNARAQAAITGGASTIVTSDLTINRALLSDASGKVAVSAVTNTELGYVSGVTSAIQTQLNSKQATITGGATTITASNLTINRALISDAGGKVAVSAVTDIELSYLDGVTSAIQTQINSKAPTASPTFTGDVNFPGSGVWKSTGEVGINEPSPEEKLDINGYIAMKVQGVDPTTRTDKAHIYTKDVGASAEVWVRDEAGNASQISPHDPITGEWIFYSENHRTGRKVKVHMEKLVREVEKLTGKKFMIEDFVDA